MGDGKKKKETTRARDHLDAALPPMERPDRHGAKHSAIYETHPSYSIKSESCLCGGTDVFVEIIEYVPRCSNGHHHFMAVLHCLNVTGCGRVTKKQEGWNAHVAVQKALERWRELQAEDDV